MSKTKLNIKLLPYIKDVINTIESSGYEAWIVGGYIRDLILKNNKNNDVDIATNAHWQDIKNLFEEKNWTIYKLGAKYGTIAVIPPNSELSFEITTYRSEDLYSDSRHPDSIKNISSIKEDLKRRDFCCNAIAYNPSKGFLDPYNGIKDINNSIIKCVGNPVDRFNEDNLRILRALRFSAVLDFDIEENTELALFKMKKYSTNVSCERIRDEFSKLINGKYAIKVLDKYREIVFEIIPELKALNKFDQKTKYHSYDAYTHTLITLDKMPENTVGKWAALLHDIGKPNCFTIDEDGQGHFYGHPKISYEISKRILKRLKFSKKMQESILLLIRWHDRPMTDSKKSVKKVLSLFSKTNTVYSTYDMFRIYCNLRRADSYAHATKYKENLELTNKIEQMFESIIKEEEAFKLADLNIKGSDIIDLGIKPGPKISKTLNLCLEAVINERIQNDKQELIDYVKTII